MPVHEREFIWAGSPGNIRLVYSAWSTDGGQESGAPKILCLHGLTRNRHDFDPLAEQLSAHGAEVFAPDMPGRGNSDWLQYAADYNYVTYTAVVSALVDELGAGEIDLIGTSMGGIIGIFLASQPATRVGRLVLNDVGPFIPKASLERIASYVGRQAVFADLQAFEHHLRDVHGSFGQLSDDQWRHLAAHSFREAEGGLTSHYDPGIASAFAQPIEDVEFWAAYDRISCPTLVIRGANSDLLLGETAQMMTERGPRARVYEVADAGHAPALMAEDQIRTIGRFLHVL